MWNGLQLYSSLHYQKKNQKNLQSTVILKYFKPDRVSWA